MSAKEIRHDAEAHREGCSCRTRTDNAFDRQATIAHLIERGHDHVDWSAQSDAYIESYARETARIREQREAIATMPLPAAPKKLAPLFNSLTEREKRRNAARRR